MSKGRKTKVLKYNLYDRGRKFTGQDRSNVDFESMISLINSAATQEMVATGQMLGFYGHQVRQRFGMIPPETAHIDGKTVMLEPAFKTIEIQADKNGEVAHRAEFFENDSGEFARKQYIAKVGGFSTAVLYKPTGATLKPSGFFGFDYVVQPNYATNIGDGQLLDGLCVPENLADTVACFDSATDIALLDPSKAMIAQLLEQRILDTYDSIHAQIGLLKFADDAAHELNALYDHISLQERKKMIQAQRQQDLQRQLRGSVRSFDSVLAEAEAYLRQSEIEQVEQKQKTQSDHSVKRAAKQFIKGFF